MINKKQKIKSVQIKRRAMTSENASRVKREGHAVENEFASLIGGQVYPGVNKKDVIDGQNNIHSVKGGEKKWQIFLYGKKRFEDSIGFLGAKFFIECLDVFPEKRNDYVKSKNKYKTELQSKMVNLKNFLSGSNDIFVHSNKLIFLQEAIFHNSEVDYFTVKEGGMFHIFPSGEVLREINDSIILNNSKAKQADQFDSQKVIFILKDEKITIGEIEIRNDSESHYRQVKFWMDKDKTLNLLKNKISPSKQYSSRIFVYGKAIKRFKINE